MMLFSYFDVNFGLKKPAAVRYRSLDAVAAPATAVLSMLAYAAAAGTGSASGTPDSTGSASGASSGTGSASGASGHSRPASSFAFLGQRCSRSRSVRCPRSTRPWPSWPRRPEGQAAGIGRRDRLHCRRRPGDARRERVVAGHRRRPLLPRPAHPADVVVGASRRLGGIAISHGLIVAAFVADRWLPATAENFPGREPIPGRLGFIGREAPDAVRQLYLRKRLPDEYRQQGASNPIKYTYR